MKKSRKAPLLCTTVFPGAGYFILAKPWHGGMALLVTLLSLIIIMKDAMFKADIISKEILAGDMSFDPILITQKLMSGPSLYGPNFIEYLSLFLFSTWLVTVLDCYRLGKKFDNEANKS